MFTYNLTELARISRDGYLKSQPFPSCYFDDFFDADFLRDVLAEFPAKHDLAFKNPNEVKLASRGEAKFGPRTRNLMHTLNSEPFLLFLTELTGIEHIIPDPYFWGGGAHEIKHGGFLKVHADFNVHPIMKVNRRINVLVYLNLDWKEDYGGHFELWDREKKNCVSKILPVFNRVAIFSTTDFSYHGHPNPLACPPERSRKSLALYYYTNGRPASEVNAGLENHSTLFVGRQGQDRKMAVYNAGKAILENVTPPIVRKVIKKTRDSIRA